MRCRCLAVVQEIASEYLALCLILDLTNCSMQQFAGRRVKQQTSQLYGNGVNVKTDELPRAQQRFPSGRARARESIEHNVSGFVSRSITYANGS